MKNLILATGFLFLGLNTFASDLTGKKFRYTYNSGSVYGVCFLSSENLSWTGIVGDDAGKSATEKYTFRNIDKDIYLISWIEKTGLGVYQVLNFKKMSVNVHFIVGMEEDAAPELVSDVGKIEVLKKSDCGASGIENR